MSRATHHTAAGLIQQGITQLLYALKRAAGGWTAKVEEELNLTDVLHSAKGKKLQHFSQLVATAFGLLARVDNLLRDGHLTPKYSTEIQEKAAILKRI